MLARRLLLFALVLLVVTALSSALAPPPRTTTSDAPAEPSDGIATSPGTVVERTIDADRTSPVTVVVQEGDILELTVAAEEETGAVELKGLGARRAIDPTTPVVFDVLPDVAGDYPVVYTGEGAERTVATVRVVNREE